MDMDPAVVRALRAMREAENAPPPKRVSWAFFAIMTAITLFWLTVGLVVGAHFFGWR
jgi:hypothetical protein